MDLYSNKVQLRTKIPKLIKKILFFGKDNYSKYFNTPIKLFGGDWYVNERIVEYAFVHMHLPFKGIGKRVLEVGCTQSDLSIKLASIC